MSDPLGDRVHCPSRGCQKQPRRQTEGAPRPTRGAKKNWIRRVAPLVCFIAAVSVAVPLVGVAPGAGAGAAPISAGRVHDSFQPRKGKVFIAVIGNDARSGNPNALADAVHIVGINTRTMKGGILNFPRDSWVSYAGGGSGRINATHVRGGPELTARTLEQLTGIRIDYWVTTGFEGFRGLIADVGKVAITLDRDMYDPRGSGASFRRGRRYLGPVGALAFTRTRKTLPGGDVDRTRNQGRFMLAMLRKFKIETNRRPASLFKWFNATRRHTRLNISADELFRLGVLATELKVKDVRNETVPVSLGSVGGASVVFISPAARDIYRRFRENGSL